MKTNAFIVGAQRSGTTWLCKQLDLCPPINVLKPISPESKYFLKNDVDYDEYMNLFDNKDSKVFLEKTTTYIESEKAARNIINTVPNPKIIICLRNPVERAISNYFFSYNYGVETRTIEEVFLENKPCPDIDISKFSTNPFDYLKRGMYSEYIDRYINVFGKDRVLITFFEDFTTNNKELHKIVTWLETFHYPKLSKEVINSSNRTHISDDVYAKLKDYYTEDTKKLIEIFKLNPPYANT
jgi:hypothetical protein